MNHDIKGLIVESFNTKYPFLLDLQKRRATSLASKSIEHVHIIQIGDLFLPAHIPALTGVDVVCRGKTVYKDAFICASMCIAISALIKQADSGFDNPSEKWIESLDDLHQLITDYYECLPTAKWIGDVICDAE